MTSGYLSIVLHAHLPYVRHVERGEALEERWLFEAVLECYLPLIQHMEQWTEEGLDWRLTLSVSPTLGAMLTDATLCARFSEYLERQIQLAEQEVCRLTKDVCVHLQTAEHYLAQLLDARETWRRWNGNLVRAWRRFYEQGYLELITTAATHAFLPLVLTDEAVKAQIHHAVVQHEALFGGRPKGFWLPECAYRPGLEHVLASEGICYFFLDHNGVIHADPQPVFGAYAPVLTTSKVAAIARDPESAEQVWSAVDGYPGDYDYREYYRDIGYELPMDYLRPFLTDGIRTDTGFKYWRITGSTEEKQPYQVAVAREKTARHAEHFLHSRQQQVIRLKEQMGRMPLVSAIYDAELFGHWWYEGPQFLDYLVRKMHYDQDVVALITPTEYLCAGMDFQQVRLELNSWGRGGYAEVWLNDANDWIYKALHKMERDTIHLVNQYGSGDSLHQRVLAQMVRELFLAQSSDWAFIMDNKTTVDYAVRRTKRHVNAFFKLKEILVQGTMDEAWLAELETLHPLFPNIDLSAFVIPSMANKLNSEQVLPRSADAKARVLMLSWEFPPVQIGGLAPHVSHLSEKLVLEGHVVHVMTQESPDAPFEEEVGGVHVHRVWIRKPHGGSFLEWVLQMNLAMVERVNQLIQDGLEFDVVHAHDWLVYLAAKHLKTAHGKPLVCTIHATEHGRNQGIHTDLQRQIHHYEWALTYESERVIVCSHAMAAEAVHLFQVPREKVLVIPNGVDMPRSNAKAERAMDLHWVGDAPVVCFIGRMVPEKGVDVLLEAAGTILSQVPETRFLLAGRGPMLDVWQKKAEEVSSQIHFLGYVSDEARDALLQRATVCVFPSRYEPFGIVALEAMAHGKAVVVSDAGGLREVVQHGVTGLTSYAGHAQSLADQVLSLLRNPTRASGIGQRAMLDVAERFSWESAAQLTSDVYERVLANRSVVRMEGVR